jgi:proline dehydrogenase
VLRAGLLLAARSETVRKVVERAPYTRGVVKRFVAGETVEDALRVTGALTDQGLLVTLDRLGEDTLDSLQARAVVDAYVSLLTRLDKGAEVSVKLTALGQTIDEDLALENARLICQAADAAGTTVTLDMEDHTTVDSTLRIVAELRRDFPGTGAVIQAYLRRAEEYCADLAYEGSRVRLCKGAYAAVEPVAFTSAQEVDKSYVRCMKVLMAGHGYPMFATHDPRLIEIAGTLAVVNRRSHDAYEYQMLYGVRQAEQLRFAGLGAQVRVYVPYGQEWYGYLMRRLAERPANLAFFLRSLTSKS